jgi:hypothetical protein
MCILLQSYWMFRCVETSRPYHQTACLFLLFRIPHPNHILLTRYLAGEWFLKLYVGEEMVVTYFEVTYHIFFEKCGVYFDAGSRSRCCVFSHIKGAGMPCCRVASRNILSQWAVSMIRAMVSASRYGKLPSAAQQDRACPNGSPKPVYSIHCMLLIHVY